MHGKRGRKSWFRRGRKTFALTAGKFACADGRRPIFSRWGTQRQRKRVSETPVSRSGLGLGRVKTPARRDDVELRSHWPTVRPPRARLASRGPLVESGRRPANTALHALQVRGSRSSIYPTMYPQAARPDGDFGIGFYRFLIRTRFYTARVKVGCRSLSAQCPLIPNEPT